MSTENFLLSANLLAQALDEKIKDINIVKELYARSFVVLLLSEYPYEMEGDDIFVIIEEEEYTITKQTLSGYMGKDYTPFMKALEKNDLIALTLKEEPEKEEIEKELEELDIQGEIPSYDMNDIEEVIAEEPAFVHQTMKEKGEQRRKEREAEKQKERDRKEAMKRQKEEEAAQKAAAEEEAKKRLEEAKLKAQEESRVAAEKAKEEARLAEETRLKAEEETRLADEARLKAEEETRLAEEARLKAEEEETRLAEEARLADEARLKAEEEDRIAKEAEIKADEDARLQAEAQAKADEDARLQTQAEEKARLQAQVEAESSNQPQENMMEEVFVEEDDYPWNEIEEEEFPEEETEDFDFIEEAEDSSIDSLIEENIVEEEVMGMDNFPTSEVETNSIASLIQQAEKETLPEVKEPKVKEVPDPEVEMDKEIPIETKEPVKKETRPIQLRTEGYYPVQHIEEMSIDNFIFNVHTIECKKQENDLAQETLQFFVYPLEYKENGHYCKVIVGVTSDTKGMNSGASAKGKTSCVLKSGSYEFMVRGKWEDGNFITMIDSYGDFFMEETNMESFNKGYFAELSGYCLPDEEEEYHRLFPLSLRNDQNSGLALCMILEGEESRTCDKNGKIAITGISLYGTYASYWEAGCFHVEDASLVS